MPRPAGHALAGGLLIVAAVVLLALASPGGGNAGPIVGATDSRVAGVEPGASSPGASIDLDLGQLLACGSVEPATRPLGGGPPRISVAAGDGRSRPSLLRLTRLVALRIERLRGLRFRRPLDVAFLGDAALRRRLDALAGKEYGPRLAGLDERVLASLGAIPAGADLLSLSTETLEGQVAGLYIPQSRELLVRASRSEPGPIEILTVSHELEHALADGALGLPLGEHPKPGRADATAARLALIEGDATLSMQLYSERYVSLADQLSLLADDSLGDSQRQFDQLPDFLQRQLLFPYIGGLSYACERAGDGIEGIDAAYRDPPRTTWEILFPDQGPEGRPVTPPALAALGHPWKRALRTELGAAPLSWLLAAPGGDPARGLEDPEAAVEGWAGDELELWTDGPRSAVGISLATRGEPLCGAMRDWWRARAPGASESASAPGTASFDGPGRDAAISCGGGWVRVGIAPDVEVAQALAAPVGAQSTPRAASSGAAG